ncbi:MAG: cyclic nucleotide-binding domain-containing protein [Anaerolineae bacterium]|nr:cyclic nucleotide-binding domain-containing protein [Anaerolineae bacterium]
MPNSLTKQLKQVPLFAKLSRDDLKAVAKLVKRERYPAGSVVCHQGEIGRTAYLVESGKLRVLHVDPEGIEREVDRLGPGDYFGETSLLLGEPRDATVEVVREITVEVAREAVLLCLHKEDFDQLIKEQPSVLESLQMRADVAQKHRAKRFKWQYPDEVVILRLHKHKVVLIRHLIFPAFALLVDLLGCGYWYLQSGSTLALAAGALLALIPLVFTLYLIVDHYNDNYVVTNKRVVHEERVPLVRESRAEAPLRTVQNIQGSQEGLLAQMYDFGDLIIETAGERGHVIFRQIPNPAEARDDIFEQIRRVQAGARAEERSAIRDALHHQFGITIPKAPAPSPGAVRPKRGFKLTLPSWVPALVRLFHYFLPPLRYERGDTITWRKHWIALIKPIALPTVLIVAATSIAIYLALYNLSNLAPTLIGYGTLMIFLLLWWIWRFSDWQNDTYQVTATRIIDVERLPFYLREERREASLGMIQNIGLEIFGVLGKLFNYGSVTIETAGGDAFTFDHVKDPRSVQAEIFRRVEAFQRQQRQEAAERHRAELLDWFTVYDQIQHTTASATSQES